MNAVRVLDTATHYASPLQSITKTLSAPSHYSSLIGLALSDRLKQPPQPHLLCRLLLAPPTCGLADLPVVRAVHGELERGVMRSLRGCQWSGLWWCRSNIHDAPLCDGVGSAHRGCVHGRMLRRYVGVLLRVRLVWHGRWTSHYHHGHYAGLRRRRGRLHVGVVVVLVDDLLGRLLRLLRLLLGLAAAAWTTAATRAAAARLAAVGDAARDAEAALTSAYGHAAVAREESADQVGDAAHLQCERGGAREGQSRRRRPMQRIMSTDGMENGLLDIVIAVAGLHACVVVDGGSLCQPVECRLPRIVCLRRTCSSPLGEACGHRRAQRRQAE